jgi:hypothetical protein
MNHGSLFNGIHYPPGYFNPYYYSNFVSSFVICESHPERTGFIFGCLRTLSVSSGVVVKGLGPIERYPRSESPVPTPGPARVGVKGYVYGGGTYIRVESPAVQGSCGCLGRG